ncbi:MAG: hypothetical protein J2P58_14450 [Acidimicrobiaceae bacterium]|nr:hypothetical protein [Acidimicrobiaceae bacterium]
MSASAHHELVDELAHLLGVLVGEQVAAVEQLDARTVQACGKAVIVAR